MFFGGFFFALALGTANAATIRADAPPCDVTGLDYENPADYCGARSQSIGDACIANVGALFLFHFFFFLFQLFFDPLGSSFFLLLLLLMALCR
jgi:hypothetical protein